MSENISEPMAATLYVVDDDEEVCEAVSEYFDLHGFAVTAFGSGQELRQALGQGAPDVVILDLRMPGEDGFNVCRQLRQDYPHLGIIMLTGSTDSVDRIVGLEIGADDYVGKPFEPRELLARVRSVLRRVQETKQQSLYPGATREWPQAPAQEPTGFQTGDPAEEAQMIGGAVLLTDQHCLKDINGQMHRISALEMQLIETFLDHPRQVMPRDRLLDLAHRGDSDPFDRSIDVRVNRLRKKIEPQPANPRYLKTVRGVGYIYLPDGEEF